MVQMNATKIPKEKKKAKTSVGKKKKNVFNVVESKEKPESDEQFHKRMVQESNKSKKKKNQVNLLLKDEEDDFVKDDANVSDDDEDFDLNEGDYSKFMEEMSKLDGKKHKITGARGEGRGEVSEYNLSSSQGPKVGADSLLSALGPSGDNVDVRNVSKRLKQGDKEELAVPLEKVVHERVVRAAGYTGVKKEISVWDAVVHSRRAADQVTFPLLKPDLKLKGASEMKSRFSAATPLEQQVAAVLASSRAVVREGETLSEIEKKGLEGLTAKEAEERKAELAKIRALQSYQEAKYRRQGKIKSKKFRKIARKEKEKEKVQELERLQATDPEAAKEKLEEMEKVRIGERASLKHRNASKYLQLQAKRAKFDKTSKNNLNDQLSRHRELLTKHGEKMEESDDDQGEVEDTREDLDLSKAPGEEESFDQFSGKVRKFWGEEQKKKEAELRQKREAENLDEAFEDAAFELKQSNNRKIQALKKKLDGSVVEHENNDQGQDEDGKDELIQADSLNFKVRPDSDQQIAALGSSLGKELASKEQAAVLPDVDPSKFLEPVAISGSQLPEIIGYNEEENNEEEEEHQSQKDLIAEAFADDDVVDSFRAEKEALVAASKPKNIDLTLPGWGEWGGGGAAPSKRKRKRFTVKAPPAPKRRDENNKILIINTEKDEKIRSHQVSNVPFPFTSISDYEASIRAPVGSTFVPRTAHLKMIKPRVKTRAGDIIEPMSREQLVRRGIVKEDLKIVK